MNLWGKWTLTIEEITLCHQIENTRLIDRFLKLPADWQVVAAALADLFRK